MASYLTRRELASRFVEALNRHDVLALLSISESNIEMHPPALAGSRRTYRGYEGLREWVSQLRESLVDYTIVLREVQPIGEDRFAAISELRADGEYLSPWTLLARLSERGRLLEARAYLSDESLLRRLGLLAGDGEWRAAR